MSIAVVEKQNSISGVLQLPYKPPFLKPLQENCAVHPALWTIHVCDFIKITWNVGDLVAPVFVGENHEGELDTCIYFAAQTDRHNHTFPSRNDIGLLDLPLSSKKESSNIVHTDEKAGLVRIRFTIFVDSTERKNLQRTQMCCYFLFFLDLFERIHPVFYCKRSANDMIAISEILNPAWCDSRIQRDLSMRVDHVTTVLYDLRLI